MGLSHLFILSPANCSGRRAQMLLNERAGFDLAVRLRRAGAPLAEIFSFLSGLYFRGKFTYARRFAPPEANGSGIWVITAGRGLLPADTLTTIEDLREYAKVPVDVANDAYRVPLEKDARRIARKLDNSGRAILLGSVATNKYTEILLSAFKERLVFPKEFVGRGDMSRGGLMLRCAASGSELEYVPVAGAVRRGTRTAKLARIPGILKAACASDVNGLK